MIRFILRVLKLYLSSNYKTLRFNFHYLPFRKAIYLPFKIYRNCNLLTLNGSVIIPDNIYPSMIQIGYCYVGIFDNKFERTIWDSHGTIKFEGTAKIGHGSRICIGEKANLTLGSNFTISAKSTIICFYEIVIHQDVLLSWDVLIMDTDFHKITDANDNILNNPKKIEIKDHSWIGCRVLILKGSMIPSNSVIGAGTVISNEFYDSNTLIGKNPAQIIKRDIKWSN